MALALGGCVGSTTGGNADDGARPSDAARSYPLDSLPTSTVTIGDNVFRVWVASELATLPPGVVTTAVQEGLMHVTPPEIADDQAMLFVFTDERVRGFWMLNTITPLDIAYARTNGEIVQIWQMPPQTLRTFSSIEPVMFALEAKQGTFERLGIQVGDTMIIPDGVFPSSSDD